MDCIIIILYIIFKNPSYRGEVNQWDNDIALLKLKEKVTFTSAISPICLPAQGVDMATMGKAAMVTGKLFFYSHIYSYLIYFWCILGWGLTRGMKMA